VETVVAEEANAPEGLRFSQLYMRHPELLPDSQRMRNRLAMHVASSVGSDNLADLKHAIQADQGIILGDARFAYQWPGIYQQIQLRDLLDSVTTGFRTIRHYDPKITARKQRHFLEGCRKIFQEEQVRYRIDEQGGVHFAVDEAFESARALTLAGLSGSRYNGVRSLYDESFAALDAVPPDGKAALRAAFFATESLFRLMFPPAHQLSGGEVQKHLEPLVTVIYPNRPAVHLAQKLVASFKDWIDGAHFYRHEPGLEEPAQPPIELAIYMVSEAGGHLRWLAKLDALKPESR
jgi:hypothetical protein